MTTDTSRAEAIFFAALEQTDPADRLAILDRECAGDAALRDEVERLLRASGQVDGFLERAAADVVATQDAAVSESAGTIIGNYKLLQQIGEGGFGVVFMAQQLQPIRRKVALKVIKPGMDSREVVARFEAERQALAVMEHPNIARVLDGGTTESGRPFFVMELVKGKTITEYADANKLNVRDRLELFQSVCFAVQHAHQKGIIHRDLKPANIMVTLHDGKPVPKIIDFGIAKALNRELTERTLFTAYGQMVGTPQYMSPEQAEMSGLDVDTRSDVYSLGVLLYELLTGTTPLTSEQLRMAAYAEIQRLIREKDPPKPSTRISTSGVELTILADHRSESPQRLYQLVRGDLDLIVMKALEKDRTRRYDTAAGFAYDIERYLHDEPVKACPPSASYRMWKFCRRNRGLVTAAALLAATLLLAVVGTTTGWIQTSVAREQLQEKADELAAKGEELQEQKDAALLGQQREQSLRKQAEDERSLAEAERQRSERSLYMAQMQLAYHALNRPHAGTVEDTLERWMPDPGQPDLRGWEWYYLLSQSRKDVIWTLHDHVLPVRNVSWAHDSVRFASVGDDGVVRVWDVMTGKEIAQLARADSPPLCVRWSPNGTTIATAHEDGSIHLWDGTSYADQGRLEQQQDDSEERLAYWRQLVSLDFSRDGRLLASLGRNQRVQLWDLGTRSPLLETVIGQPADSDATISPDTPFQVAISADGQRLAAVSNSEYAVWNVASGEKLLESSDIPGLLGRCVAFSPDGRLFAVGGAFDPYPFCSVFLFDVETAQQVGKLHGHREVIHAVAWDQTGRHLVTSGRDHTIRVWDAYRLVPLSVLQGHRGYIWDASFSPDGRFVVSAADDGTVRVWDIEPIVTRSSPQSQEASGVYALAWSPDGTRLALGVWDGTLQIRDGKTRAIIRELHGHTGVVSALAWNADGTRLASASRDRSARVWDVNTGTELFVIDDHRAELTDITWSPDGTRLATVGAHDQFIKFWDTNTGERLAEIDDQFAHHFLVRWSPDGNILARSYPAGLRLTDENTNQVVVMEAFLGEWTNSFAFAFAPGGQEFAFSKGHDLIIRDCSNTPTRRTLTGHTADVTGVAWEPTGHRLATCSADGTLRIWEPLTGQELLALTSSAESLSCIAWSPNGSVLATSSSTGAVQFWDASKGLQLIADPTFIAGQTARHYRRAVSLTEAGSHEPAVSLFTEVLKWKPNDTSIVWARAAARARMQQWKLAADDFARICELEPARPWPRYAEAILSLRHQDIDRYLACCERLLEMTSESGRNPRFAAAWACLLEPDTVRRFPHATEAIDAEYEAAKGNPNLQFLVQVVDSRRGNPEAEFTPKLEGDASLSHAVECAWEAIRLLELNRQAEARAYYNQARTQLDSGRANILGGDWWSIATGDILVREIEQRLESTGDR